ncbi:MAG: helix-turn-helix transcriptional regulator [Bacteroidales bacterium]|jgi:transcriptional regulator with XRE-family HTH domain|nr:helix-turn-helix transcriptional regulator [Bacteroidales bacterium]
MELETANDRFKIFFKSLNISQIVFSNIIGKSKSNVNGWLKGRTHITGDSQVAILKAYPNLDARWFLFGEGDQNYENGSEVKLIKNNNTELNPSEISTLITELLNQLKQKDYQINFLQTELQKKCPVESKDKRM